MTLYVCLKLINKFGINLDMYIPTTNPFIDLSEIIGTSANIPNDYLITVKDLLYGMMLPSGNDAAELLAAFFDDVLARNSIEGLS